MERNFVDCQLADAKTRSKQATEYEWTAGEVTRWAAVISFRTDAGTSDALRLYGREYADDFPGIESAFTVRKSICRRTFATTMQCITRPQEERRIYFFFMEREQDQVENFIVSY
jgi:hypothetical protein